LATDELSNSSLFIFDGKFAASGGDAMSAQARTKPDDTRARIMATAEALFRRLGFAKTAVADIAAELGMSPANVYRFFPSKNAIVEAICQRCLAEVEEKAWAEARATGPAGQRIERMILEILRFHKENLLTEQRVNDLVMAAIELSWDAIRAHKEVMHTVVEIIVRDGIATGEFEPVEPRETVHLIMCALTPFTHPMVIGQCLEEGEDLEAKARASVRFILRAITPR
jgi:AcrR family transcriptional regulator